MSEYYADPGPSHLWFAWRPVNTTMHGWRWLVRVHRRAWWVTDGDETWRQWQYSVDGETW